MKASELLTTNRIGASLDATHWHGGPIELLGLVR
jgi:hypothetical protein